MAEHSYNGWLASPHPEAIGIDPDFSVFGHKFPGGVKAGNVSTVFRWLATQLHERVEPIDHDAVKDDWGYSYRPNRNNPATLSCHASGTALDWNATRHPNGRRGTFNGAQVATIHAICKEAGVVKWGGDFHGTPDEMHFEIDGTPQDVALAAARLSHTEEEDMTPEQWAFIQAMNTKLDDHGKGIINALTSLKDIDQRLAALEAKGQ